MLPAALLSACSGPSPVEVREHTAAALSQLLQEAGDTAEAARRLAGVKSLLEGLDAAFPGLRLAREVLPKAGAASLGASAAKAAARLDELLAPIFNDANLESSGTGSSTFLVRGASVCAARASSCIAEVDRLQLRLRATLAGSSDGDGVDLALSIGSSGELAVLELRPTSARLQVSLAAARAAAEALARAGELELSLAELPQVARGVLALTLTRHAPGDLSLALSVLEAVELQGAIRGGTYRVAVEARDPVASLRVAPANGTLAVACDWGTLEALLPLRALVREKAGAPTTGGQLSLMLAGLHASLGLDASGVARAALDLGASPSWLKLDGKTLVQVLLNAGGAVEAAVPPWQGLPRCAVTPRLDLEVHLDLAPLDPWLDEAAPAWARGELYRLRLADPSGRPEVAPVRESGSFEGGLRVVKGTLVLQAASPATTITVGAGSCLTSSESEGAHPLLGQLRVVPCP